MLRDAFLQAMARVLAGLVFLTFTLSSAAAADTLPWGSPVVGIRLEGDVPVNIENFSDEIVQKVGEPLDRGKIRDSLKNLFATGRFLELRADAQQKGEGVEVIFVCRVQFFVGVVKVEGAPRSFEPVSLANTARLRLGQPLEDEDIKKASQHLAATLAGDGYYDAKITNVIMRQGESQETEVHFTIHPGPPAVLGKVEIQGHPEVPPQRLTIVARWHTGRPLTSTKLERGLLRIHQYYQKIGRLQAYTNVQGRNYDRAHHSETVTLQVEAGPIVKIRIVGAHISLGNLKQLLPMYSEGVTDDFALQQGERNLVDYFQRKGFFSAQAKGERKVLPGSGEIDLTFHVTPGSGGEFEGYAFKGNKYIDDSHLIPLLTLQSRDFPFVRKGSFSQSELDHDVAALKAYYLGEGFPDAKVNPGVDRNYGGSPNHLFVTFNIEEGARLHVGHLTLRGVDPDMSAKIASTLSTKSGQPYSPTRAQANQEAILRYLGDHGYARAQATWKASPPSPERDVDLEYEIQPGTQERIQRVILMGNEHTREKIIRRFVPFKTGEPLRQSDVYESQRKLYDLGIFNQVQIAPQDPQSPETQKTVLVRLEESRRWTLGYGGGIEFQRLGSNEPQGQFKFGPRALLEVSRLNVGGRAQTFTIRGQLSNLETSAGTSYLIQHLPAREDLSLRFSGLYDRSRDVETFSAQRAEFSVSLEKRYSPSTLLLLHYTYRNVRVDASTLHISPEEIPLLSRPARIGMLGMTYINDHRDNPADATKGSYSLLDGGVSVDQFGSQANFLRFSGQNSTYYALGKHLTFARNTRVGVESPFGSLERVVIPATATEAQQVVFTHDIPLPERFFMGGSESERGFSINQAGPRDPLTGFPVGGNALFLNSSELRIRVEENRLGFVLFHDFGNVYISARRMRVLKVDQNSPTDLDYTSHAIGLGVRYRTPIGPLRVDVGYNLNPPRFQLQVPGGLGVSQLSHVQFFLGIGQTF